MITRFLTLLIFITAAASAHAYDFVDGDFSFNILSEEDATVELAKSTAPSKSNEIYIPATVEHDGKTYSVTRIGDRAFYQIYTPNLAIYIPASVTSIGEYGIAACFHLYWLEIYGNEGTLQVGNGFLNSCGDLEYVNLNRQIEYPEGSSYRAFRGKTKMYHVDLGGSVSKIHDYEFSNCKALETVSITSPITSIGEYAFYNTVKLTLFNTYDWDNKVEYLDYVTYMGEHAFDSCGLRYAILPLNLTEIPGAAFANCPNITSVHFDLYSKTESIGIGAFRNCTALESAFFYGALRNIEREAFDGCTSLKRLEFAGDNEEPLLFNERYSDCTYFLDAPIEQILLDRNISLYNGSKSSAPFKGNTTLTKVTFGEHCKVLPMMLFSGCTGLRDMNLEYSQIEDIGISCFSGCTGITGNLRMPGSLVRIRTNAFYNCPNISYVFFNDGLKYIGDGSFRGTGIRVLEIPGTVTEIHTDAFRDCADLNTCTFAEGSERLGFSGDPFVNSPLTSVTLGRDILQGGVFGEAQVQAAAPFRGNKTLQGVQVLANVTSIPYGTFNGCTSLNSVTFADGSKLASIGQRAFYDCSSLSEISIPGSVQSIGDFCFNGCSALKSVIFAASSESLRLGIGNGDGNQGYGLFFESPLESVSICRPIDYSSDRYFRNYSPFYGQTGLKTVQLADGVTEIGPYLFQNCTTLEGITLPSTVKSVYNNAFNGCSSLKFVTLGESLESIDNYAFTGCPITSICSLAQKAPLTAINYPVFDSDTFSASLKIPEGDAIRSYNTADVWKNFFNVSTLVSDDVYVYLISLDKNEIKLKAGETAEITATVIPDNAAARELEWSSSDEAIASVVNGTVKAHKMGLAVITATATDGSGVHARCEVDVTDSDGLNSVTGDAVNVYVESFRIMVKNVPAGVVVRIFGLDGTEIMRETSAGAPLVFEPAATGCYLVSVGTQTFKVAIR